MSISQSTVAAKLCLTRFSILCLITMLAAACGDSAGGSGFDGGDDGQTDAQVDPDGDGGQSDGDGVQVDGAPDADVDDGADGGDPVADGDPTDGSDNDDGGDLDLDGGDEPQGCAADLSAPMERIWPIAGELFYVQLGLGGFMTGESAIVVGPEGTIMVIDVGASPHDDDVRDMLADLVEQMNTNGGYDHGPFSPTDLDHVVITHFHGDHASGLEDLRQEVDIRGKLIHRGLVDATNAANDGTMQKTCEAAAALPGAEVALCTGPEVAPCDPGSWVGWYPSSSCPGLEQGDLEVADDSGTSYLELGLGARVHFIGADGTMNGDRYEDLVGPMHSEDSNGENARSIVGLLSHGHFRMLFAGDLTGGPSDTDPLEPFFAQRIGLVSDVDELGIDVLHAGHHGRNTSSTPPWVNRLLPNDGLSRNAIMAVSLASVTSPHSEALSVLLDEDRLADGRGWTNMVGAAGDSHPLLYSASGGHIVIRTIDGGAAYQIQAIGSNGNVLASGAYHSVRGCR